MVQTFFIVGKMMATVMISMMFPASSVSVMISMMFTTSTSLILLIAAASDGPDHVLSIVVMTPPILSFTINIRIGEIRIISTFFEFGLEFRMSICQMNDENASIGCLIIAVVTMKQSGLIRTFICPKILEMLTDDMLTVAGVIEGDLFAHATNKSNRAISRTVLACKM